MDFSQALDRIKIGHRLARSGCNGSGITREAFAQIAGAQA
jgi:hypothetical protein